MSDKDAIQDLDAEILNRMMQHFLEEASEHLDQMNLKLVQLEGDLQDEELINDIFRIVHTLKGSAGFVGLEKISELSLNMERVLSEVRKGTYPITGAIVDVLYDGLYVLTVLLDKATANDRSEVDLSRILGRLEGIPDESSPELQPEPDEQEAAPLESQELLGVYKQGYDQLAVLKHFVYSSAHLSDEESLAVLFSQQIHKRMSVERNAVWLVEDGQRVVEVARDGKLVGKRHRQSLDIDSSEVLKRVIREQLVLWASSDSQVSSVEPDFESPVLFPIKAQPEAYGFLAVDPENLAEVEVYQFVGQFAAMILKISRLHQTVEGQRKELNEMTEILFKQNAQLSSLYHVELEMMKATDPVHLCRHVVETAVGGLEARTAAAFLIDESSGELIGASESGGLQGIESLRLPIDEVEPFRQAIQSGRIITYRNDPEEFQLGPNRLENWVVLCLKGRNRPQGVLMVEIDDDDISDSISLLANYAGILLDNLTLQREI